MNSQNQTNAKDDVTERRLMEHTNFITRRPEYFGITGMLTTIVASCDKSGLKPPMISFEAAHDHIYGENGCKWCRRNFEIAKKQEKAIYNRKPARHSGFEC